jgi:hypothetical protein
MKTCAIICIERKGRLIPVCRTQKKSVLRDVADAALTEIEEAAAAETDDVLRRLLSQEHGRLEKALLVLGLRSDEAGQCKA